MTDSDLFVALEKAFRRRTKRCGRCVFSLPFRVPARARRDANWSVIPSDGCSENCRMVFEDLLHEFQSTYRLSDTGRFRLVGSGGDD